MGKEGGEANAAVERDCNHRSAHDPVYGRQLRQERGPGILTTIIAGQVAETFGTLPPYLRFVAVRAQVLKDLEKCFGTKAREYTQFIVADWPANAWIGGAFTAYLGPGVWALYGR